MARERDYQLGIIINPEVGEDQARAVVERVNGIVDAVDGRVIRVIAWGRRRLAYPIGHHRDGLYFWFDTQLPPQAVAEIERQLRVNEAIIRHLLTLRDSHVVAQERERAEEAEARAAQAATEAPAAPAEHAPVEAEHAPVEAEHAPVEAEHAPVEAEHAPIGAEAQQPEPVGEAEPTPASEATRSRS